MPCGCNLVLTLNPRSSELDSVKNQADVNAKKENGFTPLHWAAQEGKTECAALLLQRRLL